MTDSLETSEDMARPYQPGVPKAPSPNESIRTRARFAVAHPDILHTPWDMREIIAGLLAEDGYSADQLGLMRMLAGRARSFPNFPIGYHMPEVFEAIGEDPPKPPGAGPESVTADNLPLILFDSYGVHQALTDKAKLRTTPESTADVLDAVVRLLRPLRVAA